MLNLVNELMLYAEDCFAVRGSNPYSTTLSQAADRIRELAEWKNMSACEACATIPSVMEYVQQLEKERDELKAEVATLKTVPMKYRRMEFNAKLQTENDELKGRVAFLEAVEAALKDLPYKGTCADGVELLIKGLAFAHTEKLELAAQNVALRSALHKLACLGNGDSFGNSVGNCIAQDALNLPNLAESVLKRRDGQVFRLVVTEINYDLMTDVFDQFLGRAKDIEGEAK